MNRLGIYLLTLGAFLAGTAEYIVAGVVDMIASDLEVTIALAGQLVTAFSLAYAIGAPLLVTLTSRFERKKVMLTAFSLFIIGNLIALWSPNFAVLMLSRVLLGLSGGVYTIVAMSVASKLVPPEQLGKAIGTVTIGISGSLVLGVPFGVAISGWLNWQMGFGILALVSLFLMIGITRVIPSLPGGESIPYKQQFSVIRNRKVISGFFVTLLWITGYATAYTYLTPFLRETVHMETFGIGVTMLILGLFAMIGSHLGGYGTDRWGPAKIAISSIIIHAIALLLLPVLTGTIVTVVIMVAIWIGSAWVTSPTLQTYLIQQTPAFPDLVLSLNTSVLQFGVALGAGLGGLIVNATGTVTNTPWAGGFILALAAVAAIVSFSIPSRGNDQALAKKI